jgi:hypothetical protein
MDVRQLRHSTLSTHNYIFKSFCNSLPQNEDYPESCAEILLSTGFLDNVKELKNPESKYTKNFIKVIWFFIDHGFERRHMQMDDIAAALRKIPEAIDKNLIFDKEAMGATIERAIKLYKIMHDA